MRDRRETVESALAERRSAEVRLAITGAGGWLGRELTDLLLDAWGIGSSEQLLLLASSTRKIRLASGRQVQLHSLVETDVAAFAPTHIVHLAFLTRERVSDMPVEEYVAINRGLTNRAIELMNLPTVNGFMFSSSGAALSSATGTDADLYGELKREDESELPTAAAMLGKNCVTCRVWSVSGANIQKVEHFALGSLITHALAGGPLQVRAAHLAFRRYVDAGEFLGLGLLALLSGESTVVDSAGERLEIGDLASKVAAVLSPGVQICRPEVAVNTVDDYCADPTSMKAAAARYGLTFMELEEQIVRTARGISVSRHDRQFGP